MPGLEKSDYLAPIMSGAFHTALALIVLAGLTLMGCAPEPVVDENGDINIATEVEPEPTRERFPREVIQKAEATLRAEPKVADLVYDESLAVEWNIAVKDDGTPRHGLAGYFCLVLDELGAVDDETEVRIVDIAQVQTKRDAYRDYQLGTVNCRSGEHFE